MLWQDIVGSRGLYYSREAVKIYGVLLDSGQQGELRHSDMQRKVIAELLDDDLGTTVEIAGSLADLRRISAWFGGTRTTVALLRQVARTTGCREMSVLEIGAGAGDVPLAAQRALARDNIELSVTLLDRAWSHLPTDRTTAVVGDALYLPFRDNAFDVVSSSLLAHHFEPDELRRFACEALRVCRHAVLINDLIRSRIASGAGLSGTAALPQPHHVA